MKHSPMVYASFISTMWKERNPVTMILKELVRMVNVMLNLKKNMRASQRRIRQLKTQSEKLETIMEQNTGSGSGAKFNTWR